METVATNLIMKGKKQNKIRNFKENNLLHKMFTIKMFTINWISKTNIILQICSIKSFKSISFVFSTQQIIFQLTVKPKVLRAFDRENVDNERVLQTNQKSADTASRNKNKQI